MGDWRTRGNHTVSPLPVPFSRDKGSCSELGISLTFPRRASKMGVNHRADRNQCTFYIRGPKTTKEAFQGEIQVATPNPKASGCNFALTHFSPIQTVSLPQRIGLKPKEYSSTCSCSGSQHIPISLGRNSRQKIPCSSAEETEDPTLGFNKHRENTYDVITHDSTPLRTQSPVGY